MRLLITIVLLAVVGLLGPAGEAAAQGPVKIGFLAPLSGAALGLEPATTDLVAMSFGGFVGIANCRAPGHYLTSAFALKAFHAADDRRWIHNEEMRRPRDDRRHRHSPNHATAPVISSTTNASSAASS